MLPLGIVGVVYAIWTLSDYLLAAVVAMAIAAAFILIWGRVKGLDMRERVSLAQTAQAIRDTAEYLPVWDEEVERWILRHGQKREDVESRIGSNRKR